MARYHRRVVPNCAGAARQKILSVVHARLYGCERCLPALLLALAGREADKVITF
ncbi:hypothetical protein [Ottowia sp.]|uniref:hypothetical protein n=1 Tax=Ottowia sp. TaxID=1898956 RepID=UPI00260F8B2C|nr:hypothetical protein [Ottowia sp.]